MKFIRNLTGNLSNMFYIVIALLMSLPFISSIPGAYGILNLVLENIKTIYGK